MIRSFGTLKPFVHEKAWVAPGAVLVGEVSLGKNASVFYGAVLRGDINSVNVGEGSNIQDNCTLHVSDDFCVEVGKDCTIGHNAVLHACTLGDRVLVGMGAVILDGVSIGDDCIVGAGALVTQGKTFPPRSMIVGSPARLVRELKDEELSFLPASAEKYRRVMKKHAKSTE